VHQGENATMFTGTQDYTPAEWARFEAWLDRVYVDFTSKVADGRKLSKDKVLEIAKGRIWSGQDAKNLGLVDELGGYDTALRLAKRAAGVREDEEVRIVEYPRPKGFLESELGWRSPDNSEKESVGQAMARILELVQPVARQLDAAGIRARNSDQDNVLRMNQVSSEP
jgi:protease-4